MASTNISPWCRFLEVPRRNEIPGIIKHAQTCTGLLDMALLILMVWPLALRSMGRVIDLSGLHAILWLKDNWRTSKVIHNGQWQLIISEVTEIWTQIVNVQITGNEDTRRWLPNSSGYKFNFKSATEVVRQKFPVFPELWSAFKAQKRPCAH